MNFQVRYTDIDPDTGLVSNDELIAQCKTDTLARWVLTALEKDWYSPDGPNDPNRSFYILDCSISL
jgi:hypothetical protein